MSNIMSKEEILSHVQKTIGDYGGENQYSETQCMEAMELYASQQHKQEVLRWVAESLEFAKKLKKVFEGQQNWNGQSDCERLIELLESLSPQQSADAVDDRFEFAEWVADYGFQYLSDSQWLDLERKTIFTPDIYQLFLTNKNK